jgi:hypothetical protein
MSDSADIVARYWTHCEAREWDAFGRLIAADVVYEVPQSRERIRGRSDYVEFNATYPGDWHLSVERIVGEGRRAASWITFRVNETEQPGLCFFDLGEDGLIEGITDFWPEPFVPPPGREHLTERY